MTKTICSVLGSALLVSMIAALTASMSSPADVQRNESTLATSSSDVSPPLSSPLGLNNPCILDGDSCVQGASLCRLRGGTVLPLACGSPDLVCCAL